MCINTIIDIKLSIIFLIVTPNICYYIFGYEKTIPLYKKTQQKLDKAASLGRRKVLTV